MANARVMLGIMKGIEKTQADIQKIKAARDTQRQKEEEFALKKKMYKLRVDELKLKSGPDPMLEAFISQEDDKIKVQEGQFKVDNNNIGNAEREAKKELTYNQKVARNAAFLMKLRENNTVRYNSKSRSLSISPSKDAKSKTSISTIDKALGRLFTEDYIDREDAEQDAIKLFGPDWKQKAPKAVEILDQRFKGEYSLGEIKEFKGKGKYEYLGKDKWKKAK